MSFDPIMKSIILNEAKEYTDKQIQRIRENVLLDGVFERDEDGAIMVDDIGVKPDDTVKVIWNGVEYTCVAYAAPAESGISVYFGNLGLLNGEDNGVPFIYIKSTPDGNGNTLSAFLTHAEGSVSIKVIDETADNLLDEKGKIAANFMPDWCAEYLINLDFFGIGEVVLSLFSQGGGVSTIESQPSFWKQASRKNNILLSMEYQGMTFIINGVTRYCSIDDEGTLHCGMLSYSFLAADGTGASYVINVCVSAVTDGDLITVKVS